MLSSAAALFPLGQAWKIEDTHTRVWEGEDPSECYSFVKFTTKSVIEVTLPDDYRMYFYDDAKCQNIQFSTGGGEEHFLQDAKSFRTCGKVSDGPSKV